MNNNLKYEIKELKKPVMKKYEDVKKFDVTRFEFGDYDNWVDAIILDVNVDTKDYGAGPVERLVIHFTSRAGYEDYAYSEVSKDRTLEIIGKAKALKQQKEEETAHTM